MNNEQIRAAITQRMSEFEGVEQAKIDYPNQPVRFKPPESGTWCRLHIDYGPSLMVGMADKPCVRRTGTVIIQCFDNVRNGTINLVKLADAIEEHFAFFTTGGLELLEASVITIGAPQVAGEPGHYYQINVAIPYRAG